MGRKIKKQFFFPDNIYPPKGHYTPAIRIGNTVYVTGAGAYDENGNLVGKGDIAVQAERTYENVRRCLEAAGASFKDVVQLFTMYRDEKTLHDFHKTGIRQKFCGDNRPTTLGVACNGFLDPDMLIEVAVVAVIEGEEED